MYVVLANATALQRLDRLTGDVWRSLEIIKAAILGEAIRIAPGEAFRDIAKVSLVGGVVPPMSASAVGGTYRAVYAIFSTCNPAAKSGPPGRLLPESDRTGEMFSVSPAAAELR